MKSYLERLHIVSFGAFNDKMIGPFSPGLNVVYGANEAGKSTLSAFVGGVLFGWEEARGSRNTYRPVNAKRCGSLLFITPHGEVKLSRARNALGLQGDETLLSDIDKETFQTMFALNSDELRSLRNTTEVTAKLLTAGSGTGSSPAHARRYLQSQLAEFTSRAGGVEHSLVNLESRKTELRTQIIAAGQEADRLKHLDKEFHEIHPQRTLLNKRLEELNTTIETLRIAAASVEQLDEKIEKATKQVKAITNEQEALVLGFRLHNPSCDEELMKLSTSDERVLRDHLEALSLEEAKHEHAIDLARDNVATSKASYEALLESQNIPAVSVQLRRQRSVQVILSVLLPLLFVSSGVPLFIHGREVASLSYTFGGVGLVVFAFIIAFAALVMLFRPNKEEEAYSQRKQDAHWVMLQDKKKLEACLEKLSLFQKRCCETLDQQGLAAAHGSLRSARLLLDEAKAARASCTAHHQRQQALASRRSALEDEIADAKQKRRTYFQKCASCNDDTFESLKGIIAQKEQQRSSLIDISEQLNRRFGEIKQELSSARGNHDLDRLKLDLEQTRTKIHESTRDYARILLARHMLDSAIAAWEGKSQPEVYRMASRLLKEMTAGKWVQVTINQDGQVQIQDVFKKTCDIVHLSLGTCQQLYLVLRIALLMTAESVGSAIPILADDILVNFDADRRLGAAEALYELSRVRQVIVFTCHQEVVDILQARDASLRKVSI